MRLRGRVALVEAAVIALLLPTASLRSAESELGVTVYSGAVPSGAAATPRDGALSLEMLDHVAERGVDVDNVHRHPARGAGDLVKTLKVAELSTGRFETVVSSIDPRRDLTFGAAR